MRRLSILVPLLAPHALAGCGDGTTTPASTTIAITSGVAPALVAFREGVDGAWQPATMKTPISFEAEVHGPYVVAVVCDQPPVLGATRPVLTSQYARTPDGPHELAADCAAAPSTHLITGHMVQAGFVELGSSVDRSDVADWDFELETVNGSYDLVAASADRVSVRRAVKVEGDLAVTPDVDVGQGMLMVDVAFTASNAAPGETLSVGVGLLTQTNPDLPAPLYLGPIATAKAAPDAALLATDVQSVSLRAQSGNATRALRRPFRVGGDTAFALPPAVGDLAWAVESGKLSASWSTLPEADNLGALAFGLPASGRAADLQLSVSGKFLAATGITQIALDTDIPGFKPEWKVDFTQRYQRVLSAQKGTELGTLTTSEVGEIVNGALAGAVPAGHAGR